MAPRIAPMAPDRSRRLRRRARPRMPTAACPRSSSVPRCRTRSRSATSPSGSGSTASSSPPATSGSISAASPTARSRRGATAPSFPAGPDRARPGGDARGRVHRRAHLHAPAGRPARVAGEHGMRILAGVFYPDWRYLLGGSRREQHRVRARTRVARCARRRGACPATRASWPCRSATRFRPTSCAGTARADRRLDPELAEVVREEDPDQLVTYANYPTAEYLPLESLDFLMFNVFLERQADFRRYLTRLHHLAGDRPLVLGEIGLSANGDAGGRATARRRRSTGSSRPRSSAASPGPASSRGPTSGGSAASRSRAGRSG